MSDQDYVINKIKTKPYKIAQAVGFVDVVEYPHNEWMQGIICGHDDYTLLAHRGSYKSSCLSVCIALLMVLFPQSNIIFLRKADNDVAEMIRMVKKALESDALQSISKVLYHGRAIELTESTASSITTNLFLSASGSSQLLGIGLKSSITGKHADIVITDDICNVSDRISKAERERTKLQYQELQNIKNRGGRIINTGTKWHEEDVFSLIEDIHIYDCYDTGLISDAKLQEIKDSMSPSLFSCNYELRIIASEEVIFTNAQTGGDPALCQQGYMQLDSAFYGTDYTAWSVMQRHGDKYYVYGKMKRKHVEDCYADIKEDYDRFLCGKMFNESNADKGMVGKELRKLGMKVILYHEDMNKYVKIVTYLKAIWKDLIFVQGTDAEFIKQIEDFYEDAEHDDAPDSVASLARIYSNKSKSEYKPLWN